MKLFYRYSEVAPIELHAKFESNLDLATSLSPCKRYFHIHSFYIITRYNLFKCPPVDYYNFLAVPTIGVFLSLFFSYVAWKNYRWNDSALSIVDLLWNRGCYKKDYYACRPRVTLDERMLLSTYRNVKKRKKKRRKRKDRYRRKGGDFCRRATYICKSNDALFLDLTQPKPPFIFIRIVALHAALDHET